jgi:two-component system nitrate/nitrite response regulator NarL
MTHLVIADDHALFRQGLKSLLSLQPDIEVDAEVEDADELEQVMAATPCDVLLLDLQMGRWMMQLIPRLAKRAAVVVLTASEGPEIGAAAIRLGARAVVHKRFAIETLMTALAAVKQGLVWMPPEVQTALANMQTSAARELTPREYEIVQCVGNGLRNAEVGDQLSITEATVKTHLNNIFQKLGLRDRLELARYAIRTGLVSATGQGRRSLDGTDKD